jgi:pSer/pThr/pTyr-binding forkhead associated (FHA) protein
MPRLVIRKGEGAGRDHALGGECVVGRHPGVTFPIEDNLASRRHFRVFQEGGIWMVEDLRSTNGTRVNGERVERQSLRDGDAITAGSTELVFVQKDLLGSGGEKSAASGTIPGRRGPVPAPVRRRRRI